MNDNLLISEYYSKRTEIARHPVMKMYQGELKELSGLFSLLVAPDLELACASKVLYLQAKKQWVQTTISLLFLETDIFKRLITRYKKPFESSNGIEN